MMAFWLVFLIIPSCKSLSALFTRVSLQMNFGKTAPHAGVCMTAQPRDSRQPRAADSIVDSANVLMVLPKPQIRGQ